MTVEDLNLFLISIVTSAVKHIDTNQVLRRHLGSLENSKLTQTQRMDGGQTRLLLAHVGVGLLQALTDSLLIFPILLEEEDRVINKHQEVLFAFKRATT